MWIHSYSVIPDGILGVKLSQYYYFKSKFFGALKYADNISTHFEFFLKHPDLSYELNIHKVCVSTYGEKLNTNEGNCNKRIYSF